MAYLMKKILLVGAIIATALGGAFFYKTGGTVMKVTTNANVLGSLVNTVTKKKVLKGEAQDRINIALLGMRGKGVDGGGLLTDTIIIVSYFPSRNEMTMVSIPRDLAINASGERINKIYYDGEERGGEGSGLVAIKEKLSEVTGQPIHYAVRINFAGFEQMIDAVGGIDITRDTPFEEPLQFHEEKVCDGDKGGVFTVPSGNYDIKRNEKGKIVAQYPLCYNKDEECGGVFRVPAGQNTLDGETALCYVRARVTSSDFDRARRQQEVIDAFQKKALSVGTLTDFSKISALLDALGDNIQTDMQLWEMQRFFTFYTEKGFPTVIAQRVLDSSEEGLLYVPEGAGKDGRAYILRPRGDNYDRIHALFEHIGDARDTQQ